MASADTFAAWGTGKGIRSYANRRFGDEANRLYGVLNNRLAERPYLAGDAYTIADMISYPWTVNWKRRGKTSRSSSISSAGLRRSARGRPCNVAWP